MHLLLQLIAFLPLFFSISLSNRVFTTLLIWNLIFSRCILGEKITKFKALGSIVILVGVILCIHAAPSLRDNDRANNDDEENEVEKDDQALTPTEVLELSKRLIGAVYVSLLMFCVISSIVTINWYEMTYPLTAVSDELSRAKAPPRWLDRVMSLVYPVSLGIDEGIAHLTMKASVGMIDTCSDAGECRHPIMFVFIAIWVIASLATLWWLRRVFSRYETTEALPVEYGTVSAISACSGLVFYREAKMMAPWQLSVTLLGVATILFGIFIGNLNRGARSDLEAGSSISQGAECALKSRVFASELEMEVAREPTLEKNGSTVI